MAHRIVFIAISGNQDTSDASRQPLDYTGFLHQARG